MQSELEKLRISKHHKASRNERSRWPWVLLLLLLLIGGYAIIQWRNNASIAVVQTLRVRPIEISATSGSSTDAVLLDATGYVIAAHKIELAAKVIGRVAWVGVEMGDKVKKDQVLVRLEDDEYKARAMQQQGQLDNARAKHAQAEADWNRAQKLGASEALSQTQFDQFKADEAMAKAGEKVAEAQFALAQLDLDNTIIRAPLNATVLARNVEVGEFVTNGFVSEGGSKGFVVSLADLNDLRVELDISQEKFANVSPNQPCIITTDAYPDHKYGGVVDLISPEANRQKATILVRVKVTTPDELLKPDMNAKVSFLSTQKAPTTAAASQPAQAIIRIPSAAVRQGAVYVVEAGKALHRTVSTGQTYSGGQVEIRNGLIGGEDLILNPPVTLNDGDRVTVQDAPK